MELAFICSFTQSALDPAVYMDEISITSASRASLLKTKGAQPKTIKRSFHNTRNAGL